VDLAELCGSFSSCYCGSNMAGLGPMLYSTAASWEFRKRNNFVVESTFQFPTGV